MSKLQIKDATRRQLKPKIGLMGTAGTGKTWLALCIAEALGGPTVVIDSERGRAEAYAGDFKFRHIVLPDFSPETYIEALSLANDDGAENVISDSISHEWIGQGGILSAVDRFGGWKDATPRHDAFVDALFRLPRNVIATMRAKTQYLVEEVEQDGGRKRQTITKLGVGPVQRDNLEYEFDLLGMLELDHSIRLHKSVISTLPSGIVLDAGDNPRMLGRQIALAVKEWMEMGEPIETPVEAPQEKIDWLVVLLKAEGFDDDLIDTQFKKRRLELGALTEAYVDEQSELSLGRMKQKGIDAPERPKSDAQAAAAPQNGGEATTEQPEPEAGAETPTEPPAPDDAKEE